MQRPGTSIMSSASHTSRLVNCPACGGPSVYGPENSFRPFCCARCKNVDFGAWASEGFRVPAEAPPEDQAFGDPRLQ